MLEAVVVVLEGDETGANKDAASHSAIVALQHTCLFRKVPSVFKVDRSTYSRDLLHTYYSFLCLSPFDTLHRLIIIPVSFLYPPTAYDPPLLLCSHRS
jgi:hypothetical protein